jgi:hypothetical protein
MGEKAIPYARLSARRNCAKKIGHVAAVRCAIAGNGVTDDEFFKTYPDWQPLRFASVMNRATRNSGRDAKRSFEPPKTRSAPLFELRMVIDVRALRHGRAPKPAKRAPPAEIRVAIRARGSDRLVSAAGPRSKLMLF